MNRLWLKIFLWFWITTIAIVAATAFATIQFNRSFGTNSLTDHFARTQGAYAEAATAILDAQGLDALGAWMRELRGPGGARAHLQLLDDEGKPIFGRAPAPEASAAVRAELRGDAIKAMPPGLHVEPIYAPGGDRFWFISDIRRGRHRYRPPHRPLFKPGAPTHEAGGIRVLVALVLSGLICYGLARYLTKPIRRLQTVSTEIANGNFAVRVGEDRRRDELGDLGRDFDRMASRLERLQASQQQLIRDISHELRSPLARLQVALGLARQRGGDAIGSELDRIEHEADALEALIATLLEFARWESGNEDLIVQPFDLVELIEMIASDASYEDETGRKRVTVTGARDVQLRADRRVLASAIENVVRNALRHTEPGTEVTVSVSADDNEVVTVSVCDHGGGVPEHMLGDLFKPFVRVDFARDRDSGGYGIGLAITQAAIKSHGGSVRAYNQDDGLCVAMTVPLAPPAPDSSSVADT